MNTEAVLACVQEVFRQVRPLILERAGNIGHTDKPDGSPVTETDVAIEKILQAALAGRFPALPVYGEETGYDDDATAGTFLLVDPIDGTKSFIANVPVFTCMAVLIQNDEAVMSVIYNPSTDSMYTAQKGWGAYKNGQRLDLGRIPLPSIALCKEHLIPAFNDILQPVGIRCETTPSGGGHGLTMVAEGVAAARFNVRGGGFIHDYAPGALLIQEAGGANIPVKDDVYTYKTRSFVACHPGLVPLIHEQLPRICALEK